MKSLAALTAALAVIRSHVTAAEQTAIPVAASALEGEEVCSSLPMEKAKVLADDTEQLRVALARIVRKRWGRDISGYQPAHTALATAAYGLALLLMVASLIATQAEEGALQVLPDEDAAAAFAAH